MTTDTGSVRAQPASHDAIDPAGMRVIWLLLVAAFVAILNETTMAIAIPELNKTLGIPEEQGQWFTSGFMLTMAVVIPTTGFLLQRFTTRQVFLAAMMSFALGTLICLVAPGFTMLLIGRIVQAAGTGIMMPLLMTTMMNVVPAHSRGRMMGRVGLVISLAPAIGPTLSGIILDHFGWRMIFAIILPIAIVALLIGAKWMTNLGVTTHAPIDVLSIILSALGFGGLVFALSQLGGGEGAEASTDLGVLPIALLVTGIVALAVFVWRQIALQKKDDALLDMRVFRSKNFVVAVAIMTVVAFAMFGTLSMLPLVLQKVSGLEATQSGLVLLPGALLMGILGPLMGRIYDAYGPKVLLVPGTLLIAGALFTFATLTPETPIALVTAVQVAMSLGLAGSFTPLFSSSLGSLKRHLYSHGSAALNTLQQVAGAAGTALLIGIYSSGLHAGVADGTDPASAGAVGAQSAFLVGACIAVVAVV
ncbi:MAG: DHA2 family efflux MFS transporter permease subunit, partial [Microbacterium gubbeenense]|uniref:DHA2 family efflux MFS transporter permease subunit n=1 Tax=Microbacterium gubbeenense TaxID=159896 RepID=UPI003F9984C9